MDILFFFSLFTFQFWRCLLRYLQINKETQTLNDTIDQLDLIDIYRTFHPKLRDFFLSYVQSTTTNNPIKDILFSVAVFF